MRSDSWLAKNIRPLSLSALVISTLAYVSSVFWYGITTPIQESLWKAGLEMLSGLDALVFGFYFGSRGVEKSITHVATMLMQAKERKEAEIKTKLEDPFE